MKYWPTLMVTKFTRPVNPQINPATSPSAAAAIDLDHLSRQTMGDLELRKEVVGMFIEQLESSRKMLGSTDLDEILRVAHTLRGAAAGLGAFALAECAARLERAPSEPALVEQLLSLIDEVRNFAVSELEVTTPTQPR